MIEYAQSKAIPSSSKFNQIDYKIFYIFIFKITTTVETTLKTEIVFEEDLLDKTSDAYSAKKTEIIDDFMPILETISDTSGAEYTKEEIDVTFVRASER